jgi:major membrane immunogen (membrane-anchored lipoprotein)
MEHKGIEYQIIQTLSRSEWKWVVFLSPTQTKEGATTSKKKAIEAAIQTIDRAKEAETRAKYRDGNFE